MGNDKRLSDGCCDHCNDGDGNCVFPYYGVAPHVCFHKLEGGFKNPIGSSELLPKSEWPSNFKEDEEAAGLGVYTHCLECSMPDLAVYLG